MLKNVVRSANHARFSVFNSRRFETPLLNTRHYINVYSVSTEACSPSQSQIGWLLVNIMSFRPGLSSKHSALPLIRCTSFIFHAITATSKRFSFLGKLALLRGCSRLSNTKGRLLCCTASRPMVSGFGRIEPFETRAKTASRYLGFAAIVVTKYTKNFLNEELLTPLRQGKTDHTSMNACSRKKMSDGIFGVNLLFYRGNPESREGNQLKTRKSLKTEPGLIWEFSKVPII